MEKAWAESSGDPSVVIAVLDTGAAYEKNKIKKHEYERLSTIKKRYKMDPGLMNMDLWTNEKENKKSKNQRDDDGNGYADDVHGFDFIDYDGTPMMITGMELLLPISLPKMLSHIIPV